MVDSLKSLETWDYEVYERVRPKRVPLVLQFVTKPLRKLSQVSVECWSEILRPFLRVPAEVPDEIIG